MKLRLAPRLSVLPMALLMAHSAAGAVVTVTVKSTAGSVVTDAAVVFEPLDGMAPASHPAAIIDQVNKAFVPHLTVVRTGTSVTFPNSDRIHHQVYSFSPAKAFQLDLYAGSSKSTVVFDKSGLVALGCNIHDRMLGFVLIVDTPYFAKTLASGIATVDLPAGRYNLRLWHPDIAAEVPPRRIVVTAEPQDIGAALELSGTADTLSTWH